MSTDRVRILLVEDERHLAEGLGEIQRRHRDVLGCLHVKGMVAGILTVKPGAKEPDPQLALAVQTACFRKGLLMFAPVGVAGECIKISPPLSTPEEALREGVEVLAEAVREVLEQKKQGTG